MVDSTGKQYGLINMKKTKSNPHQPLKKKLAIFDESDEEESSHSTINQKLQLEAVKTKMRKQTKMEIQKAMEEDPSVFEYDSIYDDMEHKKQEKERMLKIKQRDSKPKYIGSLMKVAKQRNLERERQKERKIHKEREKEGEEFGDKDAFVTASYKKKMQELAEDEERERREAEMDGDVTKNLDLTGFYRHILDQTMEGAVDPDKDTEVKTKREDSQKPTEKKAREEDGVKIHNVARDNRHHSKDDNMEKSRVRDESYADDNRKRSQRKDQEDRREDRKYDISQSRSSSRSHERSHDMSLSQSTHSRSNEDGERSRAAKRNQDESRRDNEGEKMDRVCKDKNEYSDKSRVKPDQINEDDADSDLDISEEEEDKDKKLKKCNQDKVLDETTETKDKINKFARRTTNDTVMSARERYMARKLERDSHKLHIAVEEDD